MTKEEILCKYIGGENPEDIQIDLTLAPDLSNIKRAMDEYAKQVAIDFGEWKQDNRWFNFENGKWHYTFEQGTAISKKSYEKNYMKTSEELFDIFLKQYNQQ